ncbi:MAG: SDR family oxidoreductase [Planctomycetes bacterium]|nr:SDR family oxidoreductase [Planctomycetota bacterium]
MQSSPFALDGKLAVVTGGGGVLGSAMARALARAGARLVLIGRTRATLDAAVASIREQGGDAHALVADVLSREALATACADVLGRFGTPSVLVHAAGGNRPGATVPPDRSVFHLDPREIDAVFALNFNGTLLPTLAFAEAMAAHGSGSIITISSMAASRPLTRVLGYSAAKAAVENLTRWLAVELARKHGAGLRVNAIAPGFFVTEQNRRLLLAADGTPSERGAAVLAHTPLARFGEAGDLDGAVVWLASDASRFVTGAVIPVDGGFGAFAGV